ncbi:MAG: hypothetical protein ABI658_01815 [Acidimicrobiales bacterium]
MHRWLVGCCVVMAVTAVACGDSRDTIGGSTSIDTTIVAAITAPSTADTLRPPTRPTTVTTTTVTADCSAAGLSPDLAALADRNGSGVHYSFGTTGDAIAYWRHLETTSERPAPLRAIRLLLGLPFATQQLSATAVQYVWPTAQVANPPSPPQLREIADTGLYPLATLEQWVRTGNNYLGYRLAITTDGDWTFFVSGD